MTQMINAQVPALMGAGGTPLGLPNSLGSPLIAALLKKHGSGSHKSDVNMLDKGDFVSPNRGPDMTDPVAKTSNILDNLSTFDAKPNPLGNTAPTSLPDVSQPSLSFEDGMKAGRTFGDLAHTTDSLAAPRTGMLSRIGDFLHSDEGRAALLRSGAATLSSGNIGQGIQAGADFVDKRRHEREKAASDSAALNLDRLKSDRVYNLGLGRLDIEGQSADETGRHNRASEGNEVYRTDSENYRHRTPSGDKVVDVNERRYEHINPSGNTVVTQQGENYRHNAVSGDAALTQTNENMRNARDNNTEIMKARMGIAPTSSVHAHYTTTPDEYARNGPRLRPSEVTPNNAGAVATISGDADFAALPSGARFKGPDGVVRIKP
jgi:hypothetical protein